MWTLKNELKLCMIILSVILSSPSLAASAQQQVLISQTVQHEALDATTSGIVDGLANEGFIDKKNIILRIESAQGSVAVASQIASAFVSQSPDVVVGVGTLSAQSFIKDTNAVRLVFSTITDPKGAGLIRSNISGVSNFVPLEEQLKLFREIQPNLSRLGIIYNPSEVNSVSIVSVLEKVSKQLGITLIKQSVTRTTDIPQSITKIIGAVDAIFISNDNTALSAMQSIVNIATKYSIPVYVSDTDAVKCGCLAALGPNQYDIGKQTAKIIARVLRGEDINNIPVEFPKKTQLYINLDAAKAIKLRIPQSVISKADVVLGRDDGA